MSFALNKHFAIAGKDVMFHRENIGSFAKRKIILNSPLVEQEVKDAVRRNGLPLEVEVQNG
jgi:hypothetical protein